jgi:uncharacterized protein (TIGR03067 family)
MKTLLLSTLGVALALAAFPGANAADDPREPPKHDDAALAKKLVSQCAAVKEGDVVQISGVVRQAELLEALAVEVARLGGDPLVTLTGSAKMTRRLVTDVPAKYDSRTSPLGLKLAEVVHAQIAIDPDEDTDAVLAGVPPERMAARSRAAQPISEQLLKRNVRTVNLGNGLYPTDERAKQFGISKEELARLFWGGVDVDYAKMQATGQALTAALAAGKELTVNDPGGTSLTVGIAARPVYVSDGVLSPDKIKKGGPACNVWLPAGEVYLAPVPGTAKGKVVVERMFWEGKEVRGLALTFDKGKLTGMTAEAGLDRIKALYEAAGAGKDEFSMIDLGINPNVRLPKASRMAAWMQAGAVSLGFGNNLFTGGDNKADFGFGATLPAATVAVDGTALIKDGVLHDFGAAREAAVKEEMKHLNGVWDRVSYTVDGKEFPLPEGKKLHTVIQDGKFTSKLDDKVIGGGTFTIDPTAKTPTIDLVYDAGDNKGKTFLAIYELKGDDLRVCGVPPGKERPTELASKEGTGHALGVFKRVKDKP